MLYDLAGIDIKIKFGSEPGPFSKYMEPDGSATGVQDVEMQISLTGSLYGRPSPPKIQA